MRVAILGSGHLAKYFAEEFPALSIEIVIITRTHKEFFDGKPGVVAQHLTDYSSIPQLAEYLKDCEAVVSTLSDFSPAFTISHLTVMEALKEAPSVKRFIVSEYASNFEATKDFANPFNGPVIEALQSQDQIEWTIIGCGLFADYLFPSKNRILSDVGPLHPLDLNSKVITIPGDGTSALSMVAVRDAARAIGRLLTSKNKWRNFVSVQAAQITWNDVANKIKTQGDVPNLEVTYEDMTPKYALFATATEEKEITHELIVAKFQAFTHSGAALLNPENVAKDQADYYPDLHVRSLDELFAEVTKNPETIL
ncbi:Isoflavone reductase, partial [Globisporangium splendens]